MNNICIAIAYARLAWGIERVAVVDFDAHFGNGTFSILHGDSRSFYASVHLEDIFPPTEDADASSSANLVAVPIRAALTVAEAAAQRAPRARSASTSPCPVPSPGTSPGTSPASTSGGAGTRRVKEGKAKGGNNVEEEGDEELDVDGESEDEDDDDMEEDEEEEEEEEEDGDDESTNMFEASGRLVGRDGFRRAIADEILPALHRFNPELILLSAGFDAHRDDPLGGAMGLLEEDFVWATRAVLLAASAPGAACGGRVISCLEGGYDVTSTNALANCVAAHVHALRTKPMRRAVAAEREGGGEVERV